MPEEKKIPACISRGEKKKKQTTTVTQKSFGLV